MRWIGTKNVARMSQSLLLTLAVGLGAMGADAQANPGVNEHGIHLIGTYEAEYEVLFGETGDLITIEKFLRITPTENGSLFLYDQCWRRKDLGGEWNRESGGLVLSSDRSNNVTFSIVEAGETPVEGSTGFFTGRSLNRETLDIVYHGLGRGIVFRMIPRKIDAAFEVDVCPLP